MGYKFSCSILLVLWVCVSINFVSAQSFNAETGTIFRLFTRSNGAGQIIRLLNNADLSSSSFNVNHPTRFIIHGWNGGSPQSSASFVSAFLNRGEYNVIIVDWTAGSNTVAYARARFRVDDVGAVVARFVDWLSLNGVAFSSIYLIGDDLGGHVAGVAGKRVIQGRIVKIEALDPSAQLFNIGNPANRLDFTDADYVEVIHTFADLLGFANPIGHADFYPNYGTRQPGCGFDLFGSCSHARAAEYFKESLALSGTFLANVCSGGYSDILARNCVPSGVTRTMGGEHSSHSGRAVYYLETNSASPYSQSP